MVRDLRLLSISGDLYTIGMDGYIRVWDQDIINDLQPPGEDVKMVQFEPNGELFVGKGAIGELESVHEQSGHRGEQGPRSITTGALRMHGGMYCEIDGWTDRQNLS